MIGVWLKGTELKGMSFRIIGNDGREYLITYEDFLAQIKKDLKG